jgi:ABC-type lipoprotein release transport system permease subunit
MLIFLSILAGLIVVPIALTIAAAMLVFLYVSVTRPQQIAMLIRIAWANLLASRLNIIIGMLILAGTFIFVVFGALLDSLNESMARSVIGSVAGQIQVYSAKSKDELSLYGNMGGDPELSAVTEFPRIKEALEAHPNVKTVVPMGTSGALITSGNMIDIVLERLREAYKAKAGQSQKAELAALSQSEIDAKIAVEKAHVRQIIKVLDADSKKARSILKESTESKEELAALAKVSEDAFWDAFDRDTMGSLEFLENKIAPLVVDGQLIFLRYVGTDLDTFQGSFDRMKIVDGEAVPKGHRGFLLPKFFYEETMKLKNARRLDKIKEALDAGRSIATDELLQRFVKENTTQLRDILLQLDAEKTKIATERLQQLLSTKQTDLSALLAEYFSTDDANFQARYAFFYQSLRPLLELYRVRIGDTLTIKAFTRGGAIQAVNLKVYGTFAFEGLEKSPLAGTTSLMDLMSFRDLYGYLTADKLDELKEIKKETGAKEVSRDTAEAELFGEGAVIEAQATPGIIDADKELGNGTARKLREEDLIRRVYTQQEINAGVVLNAAVILKDPSQLTQTLSEINALSEAKNLGIKAVSWQQASGLLGQIITGFRLVLFVAVFFLFLVAMIIINNAMLMATMQRTQTIGTMRAIGAQRLLVLGMVLIESVVLGVVFGALGIACGAGLVGLLQKFGIAAFNEYAYFFFSGPRLFPHLNGTNVVVSLVIIFVVTFVSTLFPAFLATRVSPIRAMQGAE